MCVWQFEVMCTATWWLKIDLTKLFQINSALCSLSFDYYNSCTHTQSKPKSMNAFSSLHLFSCCSLKRRLLFLYLSLSMSYIAKVTSPLHRHSHYLGPLCAFTRTPPGTVHSSHSCKRNKCPSPQPYNYCSSLLNIIWRCIKPWALGNPQARKRHPVCQ